MIEFDGRCETCHLCHAGYDAEEHCYAHGDSMRPFPTPRADNIDAVCVRPQDRRATLLAQLSAEERDLMELGRRIRALPQGYSLIQIEGDTLEALRAAHVGDLDEDEGKEG
jgi:hypothetical protein